MTSASKQIDNSPGSREIPSVPGHWLLGNLLEFKRAPHEFLQAIAGYGRGLVKFRLFHKPLIIITDIATATEIFKTNSQNFPRGTQRKALQSVLGLGLITQEGKLWKHQRRVVAQAFRPDFLQYSLDQNGRLVSNLLQGWEQRLGTEEAIDAVEEMRRITLSVIVRALFSIDIDLARNEKLYQAIINANHLMFRRHTSLVGLPDWIPTPLNRAIAATRNTMNDFIDECLAEKEADNSRGSQDIVDHFLQEETDGEINRAQIYDEIRTLLVAGFETTATSLAWTLYLIARHPEINQEWHEELDAQLQGRVPVWEDMKNLPITESIVKEGLRLYPPAYALTRTCLQEAVVNGYRIPAGASLALSIYGIQRSELYFASPDEFDPARFRANASEEGFIPFGLGKHVCIGNRFSILEATLILACIGQRYELSQQQDKSIKPNAQVTLLPSERIMLRLKRR
jgi:cytochrome P450